MTLPGPHPAWLARAVTWARDTLPETVSVRRNTPTSDGQGGTTASWAEAFTSPARRRSLTNVEERLIAGKLDAVTPYAVVMPAGTAIKQSDRLVFTETDATITLEVIGFGHDSYETTHVALCAEVAGS